LLEAQDLAAIRGDRLVFVGIRFAVPAGGALVLSGPNGAGKSTLLRVLAGLCRAEAGRLLWRGKDALGTLEAAYLGHLDAVKAGLTLAENLRPWGARPAAALEAVGLGALADLPARLLSAGQRRRLALARLALRPAPVWLLDEPTVGLDEASVARFGAMAARHRAGGGLIVAATHLPLPLPGATALALGA
jgi:heme exporter protein A